MKILLPIIFFSLPTLACESFLPENNLKIPISKKLNEIDELSYNEVLEKVEKVYSPIAERYGGKLNIQRMWSSEVVNAGTYKDGKEWVIRMYGGLARHQAITKDALALVVCHEIGHHIGGAPKKTIDNKTHWATTEGQADYFATLKCLRRIWMNEPYENNSLPPKVSELCQTPLCKRIAMAGLSVSKMNASVTGASDTSFDLPDETIVEATYEMHPKAQCRLDTYFAGAVCRVDVSENVSQTDETKGTCHPIKKSEIGNRPLCWFKPKE